MKSIFEGFLLAALLYKVLGDAKVIAVSMAETLGVVQDKARILRRDDLFLDI
jgi:hypothetical protein